MLPALRSQGYVILTLVPQEEATIQGLFESSRSFFLRPSGYKENFKFFPIPGGYLTPFPGSHEIFELRRGLPRCPEELMGKAMGAFQLLEHIALAVCREVERDLGLTLASTVEDCSPTLRCIHYDRPWESRGAADLKLPPNSQALTPGTPVRLVALEGPDAVLNGAKGSVVASADGQATVRVSPLPEAVQLARESADVQVGLAHVRLLHAESMGVYPPHTDSSLVTVAPRSSSSGLEVKDLHTGEWFSAEDKLGPNECLVFLGDPLDYATAHRYPALMHRPMVRPTAKSAEPEHRHRIATPFFLYPRGSALLRPQGLPSMVFDDLNGNVNRCRDRFPWKENSCYYSDLVYSEAGDS